jgi:hypothetical protein
MITKEKEEPSTLDISLLVVKIKDESILAPAMYSVSFTPCEARSIWRGPLKTISVYGETKLRSFLSTLGVPAQEIDRILNEVKDLGSSHLTPFSLDKSGQELFTVGFAESLRRYMSAL